MSSGSPLTALACSLALPVSASSRPTMSGPLWSTVAPSSTLSSLALSISLNATPPSETLRTVQFPAAAGLAANTSAISPASSVTELPAPPRLIWSLECGVMVRVAEALLLSQKVCPCQPLSRFGRVKVRAFVPKNWRILLQSASL